MMQALTCRRCNGEVNITRNPDPSKIGERYSVRCGNPNCKCNKIVYGTTKTVAINAWNSYMDRVKPVNLGNIERKYSMN